MINLEDLKKHMASPEFGEFTKKYWQKIWDNQSRQEKKHLEEYMPMDDKLFKKHVIAESEKQDALPYGQDMNPEMRDLCEIMLEYGQEIKNPKDWGMFESKRVKYKKFTVSVHVGQGSFYQIMLGKKHIFTS